MLERTAEVTPDSIMQLGTAFWGLRTGAPQSEAKEGGSSFAALYADPDRLAEFARATSAISGGVAQALAAKFPWQDCDSVIDVGCAEGAVPAGFRESYVEHLAGPDSMVVGIK